MTITNMSDDEFRYHVRRFLEEALTPEFREAPRTIQLLDTEMQQRWHRRLAQEGWSVPRWPVESGGTGWTAEQCAIWDQEIARSSAPPLSPQLNMIGPVLYTFGTEEQKSRHLPPLVAGETVWCQGYSEPGSGSDLASLRTSAVRDGDDYVVNGQKIWTSFAHDSQWMFCLVRTSSEGPRQKGITFLLIDMATPGITVRPLITIDGLHHFNEVFLTDVRVPVGNRVGAENDGWTIAKFLLQHERSTVVGTLFLKARLAAVDALARTVPNDAGDGTASDDAGFQARLAKAQIDVMALDCLAERSRERAAAGSIDAAATSIMKLRGAEAEQDIAELTRVVLGPFGLPRQAHLLGGREAEMVGPPGGAKGMLSYFIGRAASIVGGTSEIQKGIIFKLLRDAAGAR